MQLSVRPAIIGLHTFHLAASVAQAIVAGVALPTTWQGTYTYNPVTKETEVLRSWLTMGIFITFLTLAPLSIIVSSILLAYSDLKKDAWMSRIGVQIVWLGVVAAIWLGASILCAVALPVVNCSTVGFWRPDGSIESAQGACSVAQAVHALAWICFVAYGTAFAVILARSMFHPARSKAWWKSEVACLAGVLPGPATPQGTARVASGAVQHCSDLAIQPHARVRDNRKCFDARYCNGHRVSGRPFRGANRRPSSLGLYCLRRTGLLRLDLDVGAAGVQQTPPTRVDGHIVRACGRHGHLDFGLAGPFNTSRCLRRPSARECQRCMRMVQRRHSLDLVKSLTL